MADFGARPTGPTKNHEDGGLFLKGRASSTLDDERATEDGVPEEDNNMNPSSDEQWVALCNFEEPGGPSSASFLQDFNGPPHPHPTAPGQRTPPPAEAGHKPARQRAVYTEKRAVGFVAEEQIIPIIDNNTTTPVEKQKTENNLWHEDVAQRAVVLERCDKKNGTGGANTAGALTYDLAEYTYYTC